MVQKQHHSQAQTFSKRSCLEIPSLSHFSHFLHQATLRRTRFVRSFATTLIVGNARRQCRQCKEPKFCGCRRSGGVRQLTGITATPVGHDETTRETILLEEKNGNGWTHPVFRRVLWKCQDARRSSLVMDHIYILSKTVTAVVVCSMYLQLPLIWLKSKYYDSEQSAALKISRTSSNEVKSPSYLETLLKLMKRFWTTTLHKAPSLKKPKKMTDLGGKAKASTTPLITVTPHPIDMDIMDLCNQTIFIEETLGHIQVDSGWQVLCNMLCSTLLHVHHCNATTRSTSEKAWSLSGYEPLQLPG